MRQGKLCIEVTPKLKEAKISEILCSGCNMCVKRCPFEAISIINLPGHLTDDKVVHRYGQNSFMLFGLPTPRPNEILGLVGTNGIGKSTALKILSGKMKPNLGQFEEEISWDRIVANFRGSELQNYLTKICEQKLVTSVKPQWVDIIAEKYGGTLNDFFAGKDLVDFKERISDFDLENLLDRKIGDLSGGELQRFVTAMVTMQKSNVLMFDEPTSYLDINQRMKMAKTLRKLIGADKYIIVVEHDIAILDYLSDKICCLYGNPGNYGVVTLPYSVKDGINIFLSGYLPTENVRFREEEINFKISETLEEISKHKSHDYPELVKNYENVFSLKVEAGSYRESEITVLLGQNGTGKTTFIKMLAGLIKTDQEIPELFVSYKPQKINAKLTTSVVNLFYQKIRDSWNHPQFQSDVVKPMGIEHLLDQAVNTLSGGELQRVAIILCLGKPADIYLLDEPSTYLDAEQRINIAKVIKRFIYHSQKTAFVVEHDFIMATYLADRVIFFEGEPGKNCVAHAPENLLSGMNRFLSSVQVTFRRDPTNYRPRINKLDSVNDVEQKKKGTWFIIDE